MKIEQINKELYFYNSTWCSTVWDLKATYSLSSLKAVRACHYNVGYASNLPHGSVLGQKNLKTQILTDLYKILLHMNPISLFLPRTSCHNFCLGNWSEAELSKNYSLSPFVGLRGFFGSLLFVYWCCYAWKIVPAGIWLMMIKY